MQSQHISGSQCRNARRALGLSQKQLSQDSGKSLSYIKQFETGRFNPGEDFQRGLLDFFTEQGVDIEACEDSPSDVPSVGQMARVRRPCFYANPALDDKALDSLLATIEDSIERLEPLLSRRVTQGMFGGMARESEDETRDVFSELALIGLSYATISGRITHIAPREFTSPETQAEVVSTFLAHASGTDESAVEEGETA